MPKVTPSDRFALFDSRRDPHGVARYNDNDVMVVMFAGEGPVHLHVDAGDPARAAPKPHI